MKYLSTLVSGFIMSIVLLLCATRTQAQNILNSNGDVKSNAQYYAEKAAAAAAAKRNADEYARSKRDADAAAKRNSPSSSGPVKNRPLTDAEKAAQKRESAAAIEKDNARRKAYEIEKATAIQKKASYDSKIRKYQEVTPTTGMGSIMRVKLYDKYGYVDDWGVELVPLIYDFASDYFDAGITLVRMGKKWGYIGFRGAIQIPIQFDDAKDFSDHTATVKLGQYWGLIDLQGKQVLPFKYDEAIIYHISLGLAPVGIAGKYGCVDKTGQVVIPLNYEGIKAISSGLMGAKQKGQWGFIDKNGTVKIDFQFDDIISGFGGGRAMVIKDKAKFAINTGGARSGSKTNIVTGERIPEVLVTGTYFDSRDNKTYNTIKIGDQVWMSQNLDVAKFNYGEDIPEANSKKEWDKANKDHKPAWCYYNNDPANGEKYGKLYNWYTLNYGKGIAPLGWHIPKAEEWRKLVSFLGGSEFAGVSMKNAPWSLGTGPEIPSGFNALPAGNRMTDKDMTFTSESWGTGWWIRPEYDISYGSSFDLSLDSLREYSWTETGRGLSIRCIQDAKQADKPKDEDAVIDMSLLPIKVKKKYGYSDPSGNIIIQPIYENASFFNHGLASAQLGKKWGNIDMKGNVVIPFEYDMIWGFNNGFATVLLKRKYGFIDKANQLVVPAIYDDAAWHQSEGCAAVLLGDKWGYVDMKNNILVPMIYEKADDFSEGLAAVELNGKYGFIDKSGKVVLPMIYDQAFAFKNGVASVVVNYDRMNIDKTGKVVKGSQ